MKKEIVLILLFIIYLFAFGLKLLLREKVAIEIHFFQKFLFPSSENRLNVVSLKGNSDTNQETDKNALSGKCLPCHPEKESRSSGHNFPCLSCHDVFRNLTYSCRDCHLGERAVEVNKNILKVNPKPLHLQNPAHSVKAHLDKVECYSCHLDDSPYSYNYLENNLFTGKEGIYYWGLNKNKKLVPLRIYFSTYMKNKTPEVFLKPFITHSPDIGIIPCMKCHYPNKSFGTEDYFLSRQNRDYVPFLQKLLRKNEKLPVFFPLTDINFASFEYVNISDGLSLSNEFAERLFFLKGEKLFEMLKYNNLLLLNRTKEESQAFKRAENPPEKAENIKNPLYEIIEDFIPSLSPDGTP